MAWITPKTDWIAGDKVTYADMNRIGGNINHLLERYAVKATYTSSDYVYYSRWTAIINAIAEIAGQLGMDYDAPDYQVTAHNFNVVETFLLNAKERLELLRTQTPANVYAGDGHYSDNEIYAGGYYDN